MSHFLGHGTLTHFKTDFVANCRFGSFDRDSPKKGSTRVTHGGTIMNMFTGFITTHSTNMFRGSIGVIFGLLILSFLRRLSSRHFEVQLMK